MEKDKTRSRDNNGVTQKHTMMFCFSTYSYYKLIIVSHFICSVSSIRHRQGGEGSKELIYEKTANSLIHYSRCELIEIPECQRLHPNYTHTVFPNVFGDETQLEAAIGLKFFESLTFSGCSKFASLFLCGMFLPSCNDYLGDYPIMPCRSVCEQVQNDCKQAIATFGIYWPLEFECNIFSDYGDLCISSYVSGTLESKGELYH